VNVSQDILMVDNGLVDVVFSHAGGFENINAYAGPVVQDQARPSSRYRRTWLIPQSEATPEIGNELTYAGVMWTIDEIGLPSLTGPWFVSSVALRGIVDSLQLPGR
jgi:hypothetical protein